MIDIEKITTTQELTEALKSIQGVEKPIDPKELRYVIYARKSTDDAEKQVRSLSDQVDECREFALDKGLKIIEIIQESESAKHPDIRPRFKEMIDKIRSGKYDGILSWHPDRLARNMKDAGEMIDLVDKGIIKDLQFVSFTFQNTPSGKMLLGITFVLSKHYSDSLSVNVSRGNERSLLEAKYINASKHGYFKDENQHMHPDGENFILIKNSFKMRLEGKIMDEIAKYLNDNGYRKWHKDGKRRVFIWNKAKVEKLLRDPSYAGVVIYGKAIINLTEFYDFHSAISVPDFMKINKLGDKEQLIKLAKKQRRKESVKANLLRGMVICDECGEAMHAGITPKKTKDGVKKYFYYRCDTDDCDNRGKSVRAKVVMDHIHDFLTQKPFSSVASYNHYKEEMGRVVDERMIETKKILSSLRKQKSDLDIRLIRTKDMLTSDEEEAIKEHYRGDLKKINEGLQSIESRIEQQKELIAKGKAGLLTYEEFLELMEKTGQIMRKIKNMNELDYLCRKMYMNFTIRQKKVIKSTLNQPFDDLYNAKVHSSGRGET